MGGENLTQGLRLSRADAAILANIRDELGRATTPAALAHLYGVQTARDILHGRAAIFGTMVSDYESALERGRTAIFPITAADLMPTFAGPELGQRLKTLFHQWIESDLTLSKADLLP